MLKLILIFLLFILFTINYFFAYLRTMPSFKLISHFNFYEYLFDSFETRDWSFTWLEYTTGSINEITDYTWWYLQTDLKFLSPTSDKLKIYMPILILHTWDSLLKSWDVLFNQLHDSKYLMWYTQYISWWNDYIQIWQEIVDGKVYEQTLYLWNFYTYCSMSWEKWNDAYLYDRYLQWNISGNYKQEQQDVNYDYVCKWDKASAVCSCINKWEYFICKNINSWNCNVQNCINYLTWTIDLNTTNCSLSWALGVWVKAKYFLVR